MPLGDFGMQHWTQHCFLLCLANPNSPEVQGSFNLEKEWPDIVTARMQMASPGNSAVVGPSLLLQQLGPDLLIEAVVQQTHHIIWKGIRHHPALSGLRATMKSFSLVPQSEIKTWGMRGWAFLFSRLSRDDGGKKKINCYCPETINENRMSGENSKTNLQSGKFCYCCLYLTLTRTGRRMLQKLFWIRLFDVCIMGVTGGHGRGVQS